MVLQDHPLYPCEGAMLGELPYPGFKGCGIQLANSTIRSSFIPSSGIMNAVKVGPQIEDMDIADLEKAETVDNKDIMPVYGSMLGGSNNHMSAFWRHASRNAIIWEPEQFGIKKFEDILGSEQP